MHPRRTSNRGLPCTPRVFRPSSASDATQALEVDQSASRGQDGLKDARPSVNSTTEIVAEESAAATAAANDADAAVHGAIAGVVSEALDPAAAAALEPFRSVQGMGPAMLASLLRFARADSGNRPAVEALASEVRFTTATAERHRRRRNRVVDGGQGTASAWVEGKTVVFTGSLTRREPFFWLTVYGVGVR